MKKIYSVSILTAFLLAACGGGGSDTSIPYSLSTQQQDYQFCSPRDAVNSVNINIPRSQGGIYTATTNPWGTLQTKDPWQVCARARQQGNGVTADFTWQFKDTSQQVRAYPSITYRLSRSVTENSDLNLKLKSLQTGSAANTSLDLWFDNATTFQPGRHAAEIMIWFDYDGPKLGQLIQLNGEEYYYYQTTMKPWNSPSSDPAFIYVVFRRANPNTAIDTRLNLDSFIQYARRQGALEDKWFLTSIEFGREVKDQQGSLTIQEFTIE